MACYFKLENEKNWGSLGGCDNKTTVNIALGGAISEAIDQTLEDVVGDDAKSLMDLMTAYAKRGFAEDC
ncbi:uncharacterized protein FFNC_15608 [Fusarium fujikuroi]|nr:uncharacterized protein FFNC_15608 [Fusarium fujikuroi]